MLEAEYRKTSFEPQNSIFFESFYGRSATCNPRALDAIIAAEHPEITRYWGVVDNSVGVPHGAVPVVYRTPRVVGGPGPFPLGDRQRLVAEQVPAPAVQVVLQTWHGSMFKRIGLDRPGFDKIMRTGTEARERNNWDLLLSQNRHSSDIFAIGVRLAGADPRRGLPPRRPAHRRRRHVRARLLGIPLTDRPSCSTRRPGVTIRPRHSYSWIVIALTAELGEDYTVLLRGHTRTHEISESVTAANLLDVTTYPDITELFLASDILITDYSSVMFDFSVTGRPMIFFVPDLDDYRDSIRGVYFDLEELAPGPVLYRQELVAPAVRSAAADRAGVYKVKYDEWQERFNAHDDGQSARRVMNALFAADPPRATNQHD